MSKTVQWKRGNANVSSTYTGAQGEITVNTSDYSLNVHDGVVPGGYRIYNSNSPSSNIGNLNIQDQTIQGRNSNENININALGSGNIVLFGTAAVVNNDLYVQGTSVIDELSIGQNTITTLVPNANIVIGSDSGNLSTRRSFFANSLRLSTENFYIADVYSGGLGRNIVSIYSGVNTPQDITIRSNNSFVGLHTSSVGTVGIRAFASNTQALTISGNTLIQGNITAGGFSAPEYSSYSFISNAGLRSGISHRIFGNIANNVNIIAISHDSQEVARFFSNSQTQLTGNLIITGGPGVSNQSTFPEARLQIYSNVNAYSQIIHQNLNSGASSSADFVATANNGDDATYFVDLGIASNTYSYPGYGAIKPNDAYLLAVGSNIAGPGSLGSTNLVIGSSNGNIKFISGPTEDANVIAQIGTAGFIPGANVTYNLGSATRQWKDLWLSNSTMYLGGIPITVTANGQLSVNGSVISGGTSNYGNANVASYLSNYGSNTIVTTGNITAGNILSNNYLYANGVNILTGVTGNYSNVNVASYLGSYGSNTIVTTGNITAGNVATSGNITFSNNNSTILFNTGAYITANTVGREGSILLQPAGSGTFPGVKIGGSGRIIAPNDSVHIILNTADVTLQVLQKITVGTAATSTSTGALQVTGGAGITGNAYIGGNIVGNSSGTTATFNDLTAGANATVTSNLSLGSGSGGFLFRTLVGGTGATIYSLSGAPSQTNYALSYNGASLNLNAPTGGGIYSSIQNSIVTSLTSTGLAVTGTLSATGNITGSNLGLTSNSIISGDFSNSTVNSRTIFQPSAANSSPGIYAVPSGTATAASWQAANNSNLTNASKILIATNANTDVQLVSGINGSGTYLPLSFYNNGSAQMQLSVSGNLSMTANNNIITSGTGNLIGNISGTTASFTGNISGNTAGFAIGYRDIPQVTFTSNATLALTDAGKHYFSSNSANVITIPNNTTVSFSIGTAISIIQQGTANLTVTPGSGVTLYLAGNSTSASRTVGNYGMATLMKVNTDTWFINGTGVT
jgi:hypothetical protein